MNMLWADRLSNDGIPCVAPHRKEALMTTAPFFAQIRRRAWPTRAAVLRWTPLALVGALALSLGGCGLIDSIDGVSMACSMKKTGVAAQAEIMSIWQTGMEVNHDPVIGLHVRVLAEDRPPFEADIKRALIPMIHIPQFQPGSQVPVIYDPKDTTKIGLDVYSCS
jgi:hypothetical protein